MSLDDPPDTEPDRPAGKRTVLAKRQITDAQTMRALSHPVRIAIVETLSLEGPMTATEVGERIGESPTTCSFHLRQLAKYGFVEEAGGGKGRARPWRMKTLNIAIKGHDDPEAELAADVLAGMILERQRDRYQTWQATKAAYPREWREAAGESEYVVYVTPAELKQIRDAMNELIYPRFAERLTDPSTRPPGSAPVEMVALSYPLSPPADSPPTGTAPTDTPRSAS